MTRNPIRLNLGCGRDIREAWTNIDRVKHPGVDLVVDLGKDQLPYLDGTVSEVYCSHVLEHIPEWEKVVLEVHRVLRVGGKFELAVPYGFRPCAYHCRFFDDETMDGFIIGRTSRVMTLDSLPQFRLIEQRLSGSYPFRYHVEKYLGRRVAQQLGEYLKDPEEVRWILEKPNGRP